MEVIKQMRVSYQEQDDNYLYVLSAEGITLRVRYDVPQVNAEFAATCRILWRDAQLNLLDVSIDDEGVLTPAFFILEPDYLLDISSLAECFKVYGSHPLNYVLARLTPSENTAPLLLGNIANLFLDEWVHAEEAPDYTYCMKKAFHQYALELAACPDLLDAEKEHRFFADCRLHFEHISQTVLETFPSPGYELDKRDAVLEPSYICEALGLQGRLDYMQRDMSSFIEMKSGKADEYNGRKMPVPRKNNRIQMLLYQAVLEYAMGKEHQHVHAYLLYTRYPLLYPAPPEWDMVRRVMDVRNRIVANEYSISLRNSPHYTASFLRMLTPDTLNEHSLNSILWKYYQAPPIAALHACIESLSPVEKSYFHSLYTFITRELYTAKKSRMGEEEMRRSGEIICDLTLTENRAGEQQAPTLHFALPPTTVGDTAPNFRPGDAILLYRRHTRGENAINNLVFKGNIEQLTDKSLVIRLRAAQQNLAVLPAEVRYAVEHDTTMDTGYRSMYQGLAAFLRATPRRRQLLLGQCPPTYDASYDAAIAAAPDDFTRITLKAQAAQDYFLLMGPPGTGKTSRALRSMVEAFHREGKHILLLSYTNRAVDEMCRMLSAITPALDFIRLGSELACDSAYRTRLMDNVLNACPNRISVRRRITDCRIFIGTVATLSTKSDLFRLKHFDVALVDEATQILEPQLVGLFCATENGKDAIDKFVFIGDHKQLPAVVLQSAEETKVFDETLRGIGLTNLKDSLFERLYRCIRNNRMNLQEEESNGSPYFDMLTRQGRMHPAIACYANSLFYENKLQAVGLPHQLESVQTSDLSDGNAAMNRRVAFFPATSIEEEAKIVASLAAARCLSGDTTTSLGIITPYRSQIALIRRELAVTGIPALQDILVDTVERFQGSERDVIIYSFCVSDTSQFDFLCSLTEDNGVLIDRKLNVALTRARKQLFLVGIPELLLQNPIYANLLDRVMKDNH